MKASSSQLFTIADPISLSFSFSFPHDNRRLIVSFDWKFRRRTIFTIEVWLSSYVAANWIVIKPPSIQPISRPTKKCSWRQYVFWMHVAPVVIIRTRTRVERKWGRVRCIHRTAYYFSQWGWYSRGSVSGDDEMLNSKNALRTYATMRCKAWHTLIHFISLLSTESTVTTNTTTSGWTCECEPWQREILSEPKKNNPKETWKLTRGIRKQTRARCGGKCRSRVGQSVVSGHNTDSNYCYLWCTIFLNFLFDNTHAAEKKPFRIRSIFCILSLHTFPEVETLKWMKKNSPKLVLVCLYSSKAKAHHMWYRWCSGRDSLVFASDTRIVCTSIPDSG